MLELIKTSKTLDDFENKLDDLNIDFEILDYSSDGRFDYYGYGIGNFIISRFWSYDIKTPKDETDILSCRQVYNFRV